MQHPHRRRPEAVVARMFALEAQSSCSLGMWPRSASLPRAEHLPQRQSTPFVLIWPICAGRTSADQLIFRSADETWLELVDTVDQRGSGDGSVGAEQHSPPHLQHDTLDDGRVRGAPRRVPALLQFGDERVKARERRDSNPRFTPLQVRRKTRTAATNQESLNRVLPESGRARREICRGARSWRVHRELPTGTVTFLLTDVEGSTKLLHELGAEAMRRRLPHSGGSRCLSRFRK
jgi:hypothetical protein